MVQIEYRYPWSGPRWQRYGSTTTLEEALELLDICREDHPGGQVRLREEAGPPLDSQDRFPVT
jgi:hypothetical protein